MLITYLICLAIIYSELLLFIRLVNNGKDLTCDTDVIAAHHEALLQVKQHEATGMSANRHLG